MAEGPKKVLTLFKEVWRRHVLQVAIPYAVGAWLLIQVAELVLDAFEAPPLVLQALITLLIIGFPVTVVLAWIFDITPKGTLLRTGPPEEQPGQVREPEIAPAVSLEMGDSERRQVTMLSCVYESAAGNDPDIDPEYLAESLSVLPTISHEFADRYDAYQLPGGAEKLTLVFGYPQARDDDARRAVAAGLALITEIEERAKLKSEAGEPGFTARIGVATGLVVVDESGAEGRDVSVIGQAPRLATWLRRLAHPGSLVIGPQTCRLVSAHFQIEPLGTHKQTQFGEDVTVYRASAKESQDDLSEKLLLIGRDNEMRLLEERWETVLDGDGQFVVISGAAGIGKSSLVRAFHKQVAGKENIIVLPCQCSPYENHTPLSPVIQLLQGPILKFSAKDNSEGRLKKLQDFLGTLSLTNARALPLLAGLLSLSTGPDIEPLSGSAEIIRMQTLELILDMISQAASQRPLLMILEDIHWADPSTLDMVQMMIDRGPAPGLFVLFSARPDFQAEWTDRSFVLVRELHPFARRDALMLLETAEGAAELPSALVERIIRETDGNPLYIHELTRAVLESDTWRDTLEKGGTEAMTSLEIPATLQDSLAARVDNLGEAKALLQLCSVLGRKFRYDLLRAVSGTENEAALKEALAKIVNAELLYQRGLFEDLTYTFKHILIQETAYNSLLKSKRRELHGRTAGVLEEEVLDVAQRQPALLAYHYTEAGDLEKAVPNWTLASRKSLSRFANQEAIQQSRQGIELLETTPESPQRAGQEIPLQSILGTALLSTHGYVHPEVRRVFSRAQELCGQIGDAPQLFQVAVGLWMYHIVAYRFDEAQDLSQRLVRIAETTLDPAQLLQAHYCLGYVLYLRGDFTASKSHLETAMTNEAEGCDFTAQSASGDDTRVHIRVILGLVSFHLGLSQTGERLMQEGISLARENDNPVGIVFATAATAWFYQFRIDPPNSLKYAEEAVRICEEKGFRFWLQVANLIQAWAINRNPDSPLDPLDIAGAETLKDRLEAYRGIGSGLGVAFTSFSLAEDYIALGMYEAAIEQLESGWTMLEDSGGDFSESEYFRLHGRMRLDRYRESGDTEDLAEAQVYFEKAVARARRKESKALELRAAIYGAEALLLKGNHVLAERLLGGIIQRIEELDDSQYCIRATEMLQDLKSRTGETT